GRGPAPRQPAAALGFSPPDAVYPVVDEQLLPADLRGRLHPDIGSSEAGQWGGAVAPAGNASDMASWVVVSVKRSDDLTGPTGTTPRRSDVVEEASMGGTVLTQQRAGFTIRLFTHDLDFAYSLIDQVSPDGTTDAITGFDIAREPAQPEVVWVARPFEMATTTPALYSEDTAALDIVVEPMPISFLNMLGRCNADTTAFTLCSTPEGEAVLVELDATHTLVVSSSRLSTDKLSPIAAGVHFVTLDRWNADGLSAPTTAVVDPGQVWPLLDEEAVPERLSPAAQADLAFRPYASYMGLVGTLDRDGGPTSLTVVFLHPHVSETQTRAVPGRRDGVEELTLGDVTALFEAADSWDLRVYGVDIDQSYAVLDAIDVVFDETGEVSSYRLTALPDGLHELSPPTFAPAGSSPMIGIGDTNPVKISMVPLPVLTATAGFSGFSPVATEVSGREAYSSSGPGGTRVLAVAVTATDSLVITSDASVTLDELVRIAEGVAFGTQAQWEARYHVSVDVLESRQPQTTGTDTGG
ncbi:MAG: hypothetical protein WCC60_10560, partial [Ilumatobacteraceae bacterium]